MSDSKRYYFTLNPQKTREKIIKDFIESHVEPKAAIKEILFKVAMGEYVINNGEIINNKPVVIAQQNEEITQQVDNKEIEINKEVEKLSSLLR